MVHASRKTQVTRLALLAQTLVPMMILNVRPDAPGASHKVTHLVSQGDGTEVIKAFP